MFSAYLALKAYGTLTNCVVPIITKVEPPVISASTCNELLWDQFTFAKAPVVSVPLPIVKLTTPFDVVVCKCVSANGVVAVLESRILNLKLTTWSATNSPAASLIAAWLIKF